MLEAPPGAALEAPRPLLMALEAPVLLFALAPSVLSSFLPVRARRCEHSERGQQAHSNSRLRARAYHK
jgi:hypothetical protein